MLLLEFRSVQKRYHSKIVLDIPNFQVNRGDRILLVGTNGSGKSTMLRLLAGVARPSRGRVEWSHEFHRMRVGYLRQGGSLYDDKTIRENLSIYLYLYNTAGEAHQGREFLERAGLSSLLDTRVFELSGGMRQAAALACVLAISPDILVLDEPMSGLDAERKEALAEVLAPARTGKSLLIMSAHDKDEGDSFTRQVTLDGGRII